MPYEIFVRLWTLTIEGLTHTCPFTGIVKVVLDGSMGAALMFLQNKRKL